MKDYLKTHWWENQFPQNPTQTHYNRFQRRAGNEIRSRFSDSKDEFDKLTRSQLTTHYWDPF